MMNKKSQISIFIIIGVALVIFSAGFMAVKSNIEKTKTEKGLEDTSSYLEVLPIKSYVEVCIEDLGRNATKIIGNQGGYLDPDCSEHDKYKLDEELCLKTGNYTYINPYQIPIYLNGSKSYKRPDLEDIEEQISRYVILGMDDCIEDFEITQKIDYTITKPGINFSDIGFNYSKAEVNYSDILAKSEASLNDDEISIKVDYPLLIELDNLKSVIYDFRVILPIRLKHVYNISRMVANNMTRLYDELYNLTLDCGYVDSISDNRTTIEIIYDDHTTTKILISDWGYYNKSAEKYAFQFLFAANNTNITGNVTYDACPKP